MNRKCRNCGRYIVRGHWCSTVACHARGQVQAETDAKALANNPRWLASREREESNDARK